MQIFTKAKVYDFMRFRFASLAFSIFLFVGSIVLLATKGLNYGIDFSGGTLIQLKYDTKAPLDKICDAFGTMRCLKTPLLLSLEAKMRPLLDFQVQAQI